MHLNMAQYLSININTAQLKLLWIIGVGEGSASEIRSRASAWADHHERPGEGRERVLACGVHME
jgi:hypothetical protein